jgi:predicted transcriptional regulator
MAIVITLSPELEARLRDKAVRQGQDVNLLASELLANLLEWEAQDSEAAIKGIQQGLENFETGQFRSFDEFEIKMLDETTLEQRLVTLERAVAELQNKSQSKSTSENWLEKLSGSISDEAAFLAALEYGRAFRQVDRPVDEGDRGS